MKTMKFTVINLEMRKVVSFVIVVNGDNFH